ncbi:MAG: AbrB/MazE/SpoVT family DNA-binding domain-containing protein [Candidatus Wallacebacter cryptica]
MNSSQKEGKFMGSVKVGPKGQIVIPKDVRDMFGIKPGDTLVLLADIQKGIAIERLEVLSEIADAVFEGRAKDLDPDHDDQDRVAFAWGIKKMREERGDDE